MKYEYRPSKKITAVGLGGALAVLTAWIIQATTSVDVPVPVAMALTTVWVWVAGYMTRETP